MNIWYPQNPQQSEIRGKCLCFQWNKLLPPMFKGEPLGCWTADIGCHPHSIGNTSEIRTNPENTRDTTWLKIARKAINDKPRRPSVILWAAPVQRNKDAVMGGVNL